MWGKGAVIVNKGNQAWSKGCLNINAALVGGCFSNNYNYGACVLN